MQSDASKAYLAHAPSDYIGGRFVAIAGDAIVTRDPARPSSVVWRGSPVETHADEAIAAARAAVPAWSALAPEERRAHLERWRDACARHAPRIAAAISREVGKVRWEAELEAKLLADKVTITLEERVLSRVAGFEVAAGPGKTGICAFRPHGVMAVLGPFNFPAHLPNGHIVPALLLGNTIVLKPSEKSASVGQLLAELAHEAGFPAGVFNVVQGGGAVAARIASHDDIDGI
ncbi:MAG: aldehyde dehydrogenase family protein, partial [Phycisphaerales bacterium]